ncbi:hypothetical protein [Micromonospora sp. WMMD712]|uniref:hypothetical protein n=1 Tax=Micromonospora sp. WMMD712 TaxID=3016096 RepID=UPI00249AE2BC|nr:hypothetical protein [Micromonospora sp. WMMD712]WFE59502.1 hypothetical protein O7633_22800 [Micromonospora sp. WMMD712]
MPTITVESGPLPTAVRRNFAKTVSRWLRGQGVDLNHVISSFREVGPESVFSGPFPLATGGPFALVGCRIDPSRPERFRRELCQQIVEALRPAVPPERVFVQFEHAPPELHLTGAEVLQEARS